MGGRPVSATLDELTTWDADWSGLRVLVTGISVTGFSVADTLIELGARVVVVDGKDTEETRERADTLRIVGAADILLGAEHTEELPLIDGQSPELVITSPGWPPHAPLLSAARAAGIPIWGEVELAWRVRQRRGKKTASWLALTGTNGKTTTTQLAQSMLLAAGAAAVAVGNIGTPILDAIRNPTEYEYFVLELSSFQLHYTSSMSPVAAAVLNVAEDHLDWYAGDFDAYVADKAKIYHNTQIACVYNVEDPVTEQMVMEADVIEGARAIGFTTGMPSISMLGVVEDVLVDRAFIPERKTSAAEIATFADFGPRAPRHLVANALAAAALVRAVGVSPTAVQLGIQNFRTGAHRIETVAEKDGVVWVNDSKATNPHSASASLAAFDPVVWIAGGLSKGVDYNELVSEHAKRLTAVVLIGADSEELAGALGRHAPDVPVIRVDPGHTGQEDSTSLGERVMSDAVEAAKTVAHDGDTVLFAPAAASQDQFRSYAERGDEFRAQVERLLGANT